MQPAQRHNFFWILIRSIYLWIAMILTTIVIGIPIHIIMLFSRRDDLVHELASLWARTLAWFSRIHLEIEGKENIYRDGPVIMIANHQGLFDILVIYSAVNIQFRWMAKASLFRIPIVGTAMRGAGCIPVERSDRKLALKSLYDAAEDVRNGKSVIVFPEGTRGNPDGTMLEFKKGAFLLAKKAKVTLQPITVDGTHQIAPREKGRILQRAYPGRVKVTIHQPITAESYEQQSVDELSDRLRAIIQEPLGRADAPSNQN